MRSSSASWQPLLIALSLAILTLWLNHVTTVAVTVDDGGFQHTPDYYIDNFQATAFDANGRPLHVLKASRMVHYMDDDTTTLSEPQYEQRPPGKPVVRVSARRGVISGNGDHVHFLDDVVATRTADNRPDLVVRGEYLHVIPDAEQMRTDQPITISQGNSSLTAAGFRADGRERTLALQGPVRGVYHVGR